MARINGNENASAKVISDLIPLADRAIKSNPTRAQYGEILTVFGYDIKRAKFNFELIKDYRDQLAPLVVTLWNETSTSERNWLKKE